MIIIIIIIHRTINCFNKRQCFFSLIIHHPLDTFSAPILRNNTSGFQTWTAWRYQGSDNRGL